MIMRRAVCAAGIITLLAVGGASAALIRAGDIVVRTDVGFSPSALPKRSYAPITLEGKVDATTLGGGAPSPLRTIVLDFDRNGKLETKGLAVCRPEQISATTPAQARRNCPSAIVGTGVATAVVTFPESNPIPVRSPITIFNGPTEGGDPTVVFHAYTTIPVPTTIVIVSRVLRDPRGSYGYHVVTQVPPLVGGNGALTGASISIGRRYYFDGRERSYISARCATGVLDAHGEFVFENGNIISGTIFKPCSVRG